MKKVKMNMLNSKEKEQYINLCNTHLNDKKTYTLFNNTNKDDIINFTYNNLINILKANNIYFNDTNNNENNITKLSKSLLYNKYNNNTKLCTFYIIPKVHKGINPLTSRPIASNINAPTYYTSLFLNNILAQ